MSDGRQAQVPFFQNDQLDSFYTRNVISHNILC